MVLDYGTHTNFIHFGPIKTHVILFAKQAWAHPLVAGFHNNAQDLPELAELIGALKQAAEPFRGKALFIYMDIIKFPKFAAAAA